MQLTGLPAKTMHPLLDLEMQPMHNRIIKSTCRQDKPAVRAHTFPQLSRESSPGKDNLPDSSSAFIPQVVPSAQEASPSDRLHPDQNPTDTSVAALQPSGSTVDLERLYANVQQAIMEMDVISQHMTNEVKNALPLLALRLAQLMVSHAARTNPEIVLSTLSMALRRAQEMDVLNVRLNPEDIKTVTGYLKRSSIANGQVEDLPLDQDPTIERGGCIIETSSGVVDATHAHQFSTLLEQFQFVKEMPPPS